MIPVQGGTIIKLKTIISSTTSSMISKFENKVEHFLLTPMGVFAPRYATQDLLLAPAPPKKKEEEKDEEV